MLVTSVHAAARTAVYTALNPTPAEKEKEPNPAEEPLAAVLELSGEQAEKDPYGLKKMLQEAEKTGVSEAGKKPLEDNSGMLTRRLVSALSQEEVLSVISEAFKNLSAVRMAAATGEGEEAKKAFAIIKRLNKLISRAQRKMKDLGEEVVMAQKQKRAEKRKQEFLAKQIKAELERHILERKKREKAYLKDARELRDEDIESGGLEPMSRAELEAKVNALAQALAEVYTPASLGMPSASDGAAVSDGGGGEGGGGVEGSVPSAEGGGEAAAAAE
ncbi:MAG: hypothetical protein LBR72_06375 [Oscillospiraceae bacterium]|jgi:hypothetical protein|nr:hypothetical protein [Oscillospiraceae bacterium]